MRRGDCRISIGLELLQTDMCRALAFMRCGVQCLDDIFSLVSGRALQGGYIVVIQTHGGNGQYNPHLHIIATCDGWDPQAS
jgi:hypothetical protein